MIQKTRCQWCTAIVLRNTATGNVTHQFPECEEFKRLDDECHVYAPVLVRAAELLGQKENERVTYGQALKRAALELDIRVPSRVEPALLEAVVRISLTRRLFRGVAEA
jgi:hypothetical protein